MSEKDYVNTSVSEKEDKENLIVTTFLNVHSRQQIIDHAHKVAKETDLKEKTDLIVKGALLSAFPGLAHADELFNEEDHTAIRLEEIHKWTQPWKLYLLVTISALSATVQGMDESAIGGAQLFFPKYYGIDSDSAYDANIQGIVNAVPYLAAALVGCWLAIPFNYYLGRRGTIFWANLLAAATGLWQAFSPSFQVLLVGRLVMGITIGLKSSTAPIFSAEASPPSIRGSLVMLWQTLTAFGVMMGSVMGIAFLNLDDGRTNWRYMLGSIFPLPIFVCAITYLVPESPRWLIQKGLYKESFDAFLHLRLHELLAARDFYYAFSLIDVERKVDATQNWYTQYLNLFTVPRHRSAALASGILMFGQQFCGVNVLTFYISTILVLSGFNQHSALSGSVGFGAVAVAGCLTAIPLIDRKGRRFLVLFTYPLLAIFLFWTGFSFYAEGTKERLGLVLTGIYLYVYFYGVGSGPVPFTYNAESGSLLVRNAHASLGCAITWLFCFILGFTLPNMRRSIGNVGVFCFYAAWCILIWFLILLFVPETKGYTLEELDLIFDIPILEHARYQVRESKRWIRRVFGRPTIQEPLLEFALTFQDKHTLSTNSSRDS